MRQLKFRRFIIGLVACLPMWCLAQSMALEAIGSSGGTDGSNGYSLTWTVGEAVTLNGQQGTNYVGAGFQQARKKSTTVGWTIQFEPLANLKIYPNPAADYLIIESETNGLTARMYDLLGRPVIITQPMSEREQLDLSELPAGTYLLQVFDAQHRLVNASKIQHIQH
jgi:Secretion system C-terminal sorting domain